MKSFLHAFLLAVAAVLPVAKADITVVDSAGEPVAGAVVLLPESDGVRSADAIVVDQVNKHFVPFVSITAPGSLVRFPNSDDIRHHVYSFSDAKTFELKLYHANDAEPVLFEREGLVTLGCNIHDTMKAYVVVTSRVGAVSDEAGRARVTATGPVVDVWHPQAADWQSLPVNNSRVVLPFTWDSSDPQAPKSRATLEQRLQRFRRHEN